MAISFVGSNTLDASTAASSVTINLPAGVQQNDVVYVLVDNQNGTNPDLVEQSGTWTEIADLYDNDSTDINLGLWRKVMGATPDTDVTITQPSNNPWVALTVAFRGVDTTTPEDVAAVTNTGINSPDPDPPSVTPVSDNCWILAFGASSEPTGTITFPTDYENTVSVQSTGNSGAVMFASRLLATPAAESPSPFNTSGGSAADSWGAVTIALKPATGAVNNTIIAAAASFTLTGIATSFKVARNLTAATATYTLTGVAVTLTSGTGEVETTSVSVNLSFGMGPMGKPSVHPHPHFSRHKH